MVVTSNIPSDLEIAQDAQLVHINRIAEQLGLDPDTDLEHYGKYIAKINLDVLEKLRHRPDAKYVDVTAITPTPLGEGKSTTLVGLGQAMKHIGKRAVITIRQPSQGPTFGIKGGAAGGGYSQVVPMENFNLHLTGDIHAITAAHNLIAAMIDNHLFHGNAMNLDQHNIVWRRVLDLNDRALRNVIVGLGEKADGVPRQTGFDITVASEIMAILALTTSLEDLRERLGRMVIAYNNEKHPVTADDLKAAGAAAVLLRDAIKPNLMQTLENTPAIVHCGPFANIAHGNSSVLADQIVTVRALKAHTGKYKIVAGKPLDPALTTENTQDVEIGAANMVRHLENMRKFGVNPVVAVNVFNSDTDNEIDVIRRIALDAGAVGVSVARHFAEGGAGAAELAEMVVTACDQPNDFKFLYPVDWPIKRKIETIATEIYRADGVDYTPEADKQIDMFEKNGFGNLPICMAKTHLSFTAEPGIKGAPTGFRLPIREVRASVGAGFIYPLCGEMRTMPGLPKNPAAENVDFDDDGYVVGLF
jgi:formate--tetrahydrofolate ligase